MSIHLDSCKFEANKNSVEKTRFIKVNSDCLKLDAKVLIVMLSAAVAAIFVLTVVIIMKIKDNNEDNNSEMQDTNSELAML